MHRSIIKPQHSTPLWQSVTVIEQKELRIYWTDFHQISSPFSHSTQTNVHATYGRYEYLIVDYWFDHIFPIAQWTLPWRPILRFKMGEIRRLTFIRRLGILKRSGIPQRRFQEIHLRRSGYMCKIFGELWSINSTVKDVHPSSISSLATRRHC